MTEPRGAVDYDDQPPKLAEEEDPRYPDAAYVAHDREMRDNDRLDREVRGRAADRELGHHGPSRRSPVDRVVMK